jgi:hypothetical protein
MKQAALVALSVAVACTPLQTITPRADASPEGPCATGALNDDLNCGVCGHACASGDACLDGVCSPAIRAPRPIAPLSGTTLRANRPTLRWALGAGSDGARVELCRDRAMTRGCVTFDAVGTSGAPPDGLAHDVWFWRVTARAGAITTRATSPTWQLRVGNFDSTRGSTLDLDDDGRLDLAVGAPRVRGGVVYLYTGGVESPTATPSSTRTGPLGSEFGTSVVNAGDVNRDGYVDLAVSATAADRVYVYLGRAEGLSSTATVIDAAEDVTRFGHEMSGAGDVNGDGFDDLVVSARSLGKPLGLALVYLGGEGGISTTPAITLTAQGDTSQDVHAVGAGDLNGDGFADIALGADTAAGRAGRVHVFHGGPAGLTDTASRSLDGTDARGQFGIALARGGDVNGDGYGDLFVGAPYASPQVASAQDAAPSDLASAGKAFVFHGSSGGVGPRAATTLEGTAPGGGLGLVFSAGADIDGDGYADLLVNAGNDPVHTGSIRLHRGGPNGVTRAASLQRDGIDGVDSSFGRVTTIAGDLNRDGFIDLVVTGVGVFHNTGRVYVYFGEPGGSVRMIPVLITGPGGQQGVFGWSLASALSPRSPRLSPDRSDNV